MGYGTDLGSILSKMIRFSLAFVLKVVNAKFAE